MQEWVEFNEHHPAPTFFASPAWTKAVCQTDPHLKPFPVRVEIPSGKRFIVPLVSATGRLMRWKQLVGMPSGSYTCFMGEDGALPLDSDECSQIIDVLSRYAHALTINLWPLLPQCKRREGRVTMHETGLIDLRQGAEQAFGRVSGISRRMAGQASRRGVTCNREVGVGAADLYYEMLEESAHRWGLPAPTISKTLLDAAMELGGDDSQIWIVRHGEKAIAGGVILYGSREMFFWSAAMRTEYSALRPSNALNFALIAASAERGVDWYNLGSSEGLPGVARFKKDLGAETRHYSWIHTVKPAYRVYKQIRQILRFPKPAKPLV